MAITESVLWILFNYGHSENKVREAKSGVTSKWKKKDDFVVMCLRPESSNIPLSVTRLRLFDEDIWICMNVKPNLKSQFSVSTIRKLSLVSVRC